MVLVLVVVMEWIRLFTNSCNLSGSGAGGGDGVDQLFTNSCNLSGSGAGGGDGVDQTLARMLN